MNRAFHQLTDEELVRLVHLGSARAERFLLEKYRPLVLKRIQAYYLSGADREDLVQEGLIGLHKAIRDFQPDHGQPFQRFAAMCVVRQVISAVRSATRQKHMPMSCYMTLSGTEEIEQPLELLDLAVAEDPHEDLAHRDGMDWVKGMLRKHLSGFEWEVLHLYLKGKTYREISEKLAKNTKAIDNALARIKEKGRVLDLQTAF